MPAPMKKILIANIGNSNLTINNDDWYIKNTLEQTNQSFFEFTQNIYQSYDQYEISESIIQSYIEKYDKKIKAIILICSHQNPPDKNDTYRSAKIIQKYFIWLRYETQIYQLPYAIDREGIRRHLLEHSPLEQHIDDVWSYDLDYISTGWTPQMKEALWFYLTTYYGNILSSYDINIRTHELIKTNRENVVLWWQIERIFSHMMENHQRVQARDIVSSYHYYFNNASTIEQLLTYLIDRYNFVHNNINLERWSILDDSIWNILCRSYDGDQEKLIELAYNMILTYEKWEYISLLGKIFRITEWLLQHIFCIVTNTPLTLQRRNGRDYFPNFHQWIINQAPAWLIEQNQNIERDGTRCNTLILSKILGYYQRNDRGVLWDHAWLCDFILQVNTSLNGEWPNSLKTIRNNSIIAHGRSGIQKEHFENLRIWNQNVSIVDIAEKIIKEFGIQYSNEYHSIEDYIEQII